MIMIIDQDIIDLEVKEGCAHGIADIAHRLTIHRRDNASIAATFSIAKNLDENKTQQTHRHARQDKENNHRLIFLLRLNKYLGIRLPHVDLDWLRLANFLPAK